MKHFYSKALVILAGVLMLAACGGPTTEPGPGDYNDPNYSSRLMMYTYGMPQGECTVYVLRSPISHGLTDNANLTNLAATGKATISSSNSQVPFNLRKPNGESFYETGTFHILAVIAGRTYPLYYYNGVNTNNSGYFSVNWSNFINSMAVRLTGTVDVTLNGAAPSNVTVSAHRDTNSAASGSSTGRISYFNIENYSDTNRNWTIFVPPEDAMRSATAYMGLTVDSVGYGTDVSKTLSPANVGQTLNIDTLVLNEKSLIISGKADITVNGERAAFTEIFLSDGTVDKAITIDYSKNPEGNWTAVFPPTLTALTVPIQIRVDNRGDGSPSYNYGYNGNSEGLLKTAVTVQIMPGSTEAITVPDIVMDINAVTLSGTIPYTNNNNSNAAFYAYNEEGEILFFRWLRPQYNNNGNSSSSYTWLAWMEAPESPVTPYFTASLRISTNNGSFTDEKLFYPGTVINPDDTNVTISIGSIAWSTGLKTDVTITDPQSAIEAVDRAVYSYVDWDKTVSQGAESWNTDFSVNVYLYPSSYPDWRSDWYIDGVWDRTITDTNTHYIEAADYELGTHYVTVFLTTTNPAITVTRTFSFTVIE